jgi:hypothetical protein
MGAVIGQAGRPVLLLLPALLFAQPNAPKERYRLFQEYLVRRAGEITRAFPGDIRTLDEWKRRRPEVLRQFLYTLGLDRMPAKTPLNARITGSLERDTYKIEKIVFQSMPGFYVTGNLYLPTEPRPPGSVKYSINGGSYGPCGSTSQGDVM